MDILESLKKDHELVKTLLTQILAASDSSKRTELFKKFKSELLAHAKAEEKVLYKRMEKSSEGKDFALEGEVEHEVAERLIEELSRGRAKDSDRWTARCTVLKEMLEHHIEEEEGEGFETAREIFEEEKLEQMATEFEALKQKMPQKRAA